MRLNRKTQPVVYRHMGIRSALLDQQRHRAQALTDLAIGIWGFAFVVFLFAWLG